MKKICLFCITLAFIIFGAFIFPINAFAMRAESINEFIIQTPLAEGEHNSERFLVFTEERTWSEAQYFAESIGGSLVEITSPEIQDVVMQLVGSHPPNRYWIGGTRIEGFGKAQFTWISGEPMEFENWAPGEPNNMGGNENKIEINSASGLWNDVPENYRLRFIVQLPASIYVPIIRPVSGREYFEGRYFQLFDTGGDWYSTRNYAASIGGHLATVHNCRTQKFLIEDLLPYGNRHAYWLGGYRDANTHSPWLEWGTGEPVSERLVWSPGWQLNMDSTQAMIIYTVHPTDVIGWGNGYLDTIPSMAFGWGFHNRRNLGFIVEWISERALINVTYAFVTDVTNPPLPHEVMSLIPKNISDIPFTSLIRVYPIVSIFPDVDVTEGDYPGTWSFLSWEPADFVIPQYGQDITFVGTWEFAPQIIDKLDREDESVDIVTLDISYVFAATQINQSLPREVLVLIPESRINMPFISLTYVYPSVSMFLDVNILTDTYQGIWTFLGWAPTHSVALYDGQDITFAGTWEFRPMPIAEFEEDSGWSLEARIALVVGILTILLMIIGLFVTIFHKEINRKIKRFFARKAEFYREKRERKKIIKEMKQEQKMLKKRNRERNKRLKRRRQSSR